MTASGGSATPDIARRFPVRLIESGPAAGALMSAHLGREIGEPDLLCFDMGGTTAKGVLVRDYLPLKKYEMEVARVHEFKPGSGLPVRLPVIDMIEIGAGGGSIASVDERGLLAVGPRSAGADPGPACYRRGGDRATLTDANVALGNLVPEHFLGGAMPLDADRAREVVAEEVANPLGLEPTRAAWGVHEVINEDVARAFRIHASELGFDYRRCTMVAFGGSGPVHAIRVARKLKIPRVVLPPAAGVMSAIGLLVTPLSFETLRSHRVALSNLTPRTFLKGFAPALAQALSLLHEAGVETRDVNIIRSVDMRYIGQGYEVEVKLEPDQDDESALAGLTPAFNARYAEVFSDSLLDQPLEIVNWKVGAVGPTPEVALRFEPASNGSPQPDRRESVPLYVPATDRFVEAPVHDRYQLRAGDSIRGPALVQENEATTVLDEGDVIRVDARGNLIAELDRAVTEARP